MSLAVGPGGCQAGYPFTARQVRLPAWFHEPAQRGTRHHTGFEQLQERPRWRRQNENGEGRGRGAVSRVRH